MTARLNETRPEGSRPRPTPRTERLVEVLVFLFLIVPSLLLSLFIAQEMHLGFVLLAVSTIFRDLGLVSLILFFLWRDGESFRQIGWTFQDGGKEVLLGIALFVPAFVATALLESLLRSLGLTSPSSSAPSFLTPTGPGQLVLAFFLVVVVAVAEETIFRGYLIQRIAFVSDRCWLAILLSAVIFSLGHGYEGSAGVITVGALGVIFGLVYVWRRSLVAPITMHFLQDFLAIVLIPLLGLR